MEGDSKISENGSLSLNTLKPKMIMVSKSIGVKPKVLIEYKGKKIQCIRSLKCVITPANKGGNLIMADNDECVKNLGCYPSLTFASPRSIDTVEKRGTATNTTVPTHDDQDMMLSDEPNELASQICTNTSQNANSNHEKSIDTATLLNHGSKIRKIGNLSVNSKEDIVKSNSNIPEISSSDIDTSSDELTSTKCLLKNSFQENISLGKNLKHNVRFISWPSKQNLAGTPLKNTLPQSQSQMNLNGNFKIKQNIINSSSEKALSNDTEKVTFNTAEMPMVESITINALSNQNIINPQHCNNRSPLKIFKVKDTSKFILKPPRKLSTEIPPNDDGKENDDLYKTQSENIDLNMPKSESQAEKDEVSKYVSKTKKKISKIKNGHVLKKTVNQETQTDIHCWLMKNDDLYISSLVENPKLFTKVPVKRLPNVDGPIEAACLNLSNTDDSQSKKSYENYKSSEFQKEHIEAETTDQLGLSEESQIPGDLIDLLLHSDDDTPLSSNNQLFPTSNNDLPEALLRNLCNDIKTCTDEDENGNMPLHQSVIDKDLKRLKCQCVVLKGLNLQSHINYTNNHNETALMLAVKTGWLEAVKHLLKEGASQTMPDKEDLCPLHCAVRGGQSELVQVLLDAADGCRVIEKPFQGYAPLHLAAIGGHTDIIQMLVDKNADINLKDGKSGRTAYFHAIEQKQTNAARLLRINGVNIMEPNYAGHLPPNLLMKDPIQIKSNIGQNRAHSRSTDLKKKSREIKQTILNNQTALNNFNALNQHNVVVYNQKHSTDPPVYFLDTGGGNVIGLNGKSILRGGVSKLDSPTKVDEAFVFEAPDNVGNQFHCLEFQENPVKLRVPPTDETSIKCVDVVHRNSLIEQNSDYFNAIESESQRVESFILNSLENDKVTTKSTSQENNMSRESEFFGKRNDCSKMKSLNPESDYECSQSIIIEDENSIEIEYHDSLFNEEISIDSSQTSFNMCVDDDDKDSLKNILKQSESKTVKRKSVHSLFSKVSIDEEFTSLQEKKVCKKM